MLLTAFKSVTLNVHHSSAQSGSSAHLASGIECQDFIALVLLCSTDSRLCNG